MHPAPALGPVEVGPSAFCRLTVRGPRRRVDVALPVDVPLAELAPLVLELFADPVPTSELPEPWRFTGATGAPLPPAATLAELGVLDGETLRLGPDVRPPAAPVFDDPVDALAALAPDDGSDRSRRAAVAVGVATAAAALLLTTAQAGGGAAWGAAVLGGIGTLVALGRAAQIARRGFAGTDGSTTTEHRGARLPALVPVLCALPLAAAAGGAALPGPPDQGHVLLAVTACGVAAALGQVAVRVVAPALVATVVVAVLTATAVVVGGRFDVAAPALGAVGAALAVSAGPLVPRVVLRFAGLPRPVVPADAAELVAADTGPDLLPPAELAARAAAARALLTGLTGGLAAVAALAAPAAATAHAWAGPAVAVVVVGVLLLRARSFVDPAAARVHLLAGIGTGVTLLGLLAAASGPLGRLACALVLLGAAAVAVPNPGARATTGGAPGRPDTRTASPVARRSLDIAEGVLTALAVPLAVVASGVFAAVRAL